MISVEERIQFYILNSKKQNIPDNIATTGFDHPIKLNFHMYKQKFREIHPNTEYPLDVIRYLQYEKDSDMYIQCGDSQYCGQNWPVLVKTRDIKNPLSNGVIGNLDRLRHFNEMFKHPDTPWDQKSNEFVWRGADTGRDGDRLRFVRQYVQSHDVGFSKFVQDAYESPYLYSPSMIKTHLSIDDMIRRKYLPVIDGNDKSSSLGWVMASNSVPLMPIPKYHSWMCEPWMVAGVHYVEVKEDWSDFIEKIEWCKTHDDECKKIAENGKIFMMQFMNQMQETYIEQKLAEFCAT